MNYMHRSDRDRPTDLVFPCILLLISVAVGTGRTAGAQPSPVPDNVSLEKIADELQFTEGPVWYRQTLLFTDIPANRILQWAPGQEPETFLNPSGHANGLALHPDGYLLLAQHDGAIARLTEENEIKTIVDAYDRRRLNSPNDLTVTDDGTIFFTDPPYGVDSSERELDFSGVYRVDPDGSITLLTKKFSRPNGIERSPDEKTLYVNDSARTLVRSYDLDDNGHISNGRDFARPDDDAGAGPVDGMTVDADGNLYTTGPGGVWIYTPDGRRLDHINVPKRATNVAFGGPDFRTLFITAAPRVFRIRLKTRGVR